jgi:hypothetical protein
MVMYSLLLVIAACEVEVHILPLEVYVPSKLGMYTSRPASQLVIESKHTPRTASSKANLKTVQRRDLYTAYIYTEFIYWLGTSACREF